MKHVHTLINLGEIKINTFGNGSNLSLSSTAQIRNCGKYKKNQGFGQQQADGVIMVSPVNKTADQDIIDFQTEKS